MRFFSFVPLKIIASSRVLVSADTIGWSLVVCGRGCNELLFD
jgi:hypothetical protein